MDTRLQAIQVRFQSLDLSRDEQNFSFRLAAFQIAMRLGSLSQRNSLVNAHAQFASRDPCEKVVGSLQQFLAVCRIVSQRGASQKERAFLFNVFARQVRSGLQVSERTR